MKVPLNLLTGLQRLRGQLKLFVVQRSEVNDLDDVIIRCGGDNSTSLAWNSLKELDVSYNSITKLGDSLVSCGREGVCFCWCCVGAEIHVCAEYYCMYHGTTFEYKGHIWISNFVHRSHLLGGHGNNTHF